MPSLSERYHQFRRMAFPATVNDVSWRYEAIAARLDRVESLIEKSLRLSAAPQADVLRALRPLRPMTPTGKAKIRLGDAGDGGYVCLDDFEGLACGFSFGVNDNDTWDLQMAQRGLRVLQFDHTVARAPSSHPLLVFHKTRIAAAPAPGCATLPALIAENTGAGAPDILLKCDIEGDEWDMIDQCPAETLERCAQILIEFHDLDQLAQERFRARAERVFAKIDASFFLAHVHANNCTPLCNVANIALPSTVEMTFVNRARCGARASDELFPTALDAPNNPSLPDIYLGAFRF